MERTYEEAIKIIAESKNKFERGEMVIREMCRLITDILDYRYVVEHYKGTSETSTTLIDGVNKIKKDLAILLGDIDVYTTQFNISDSVKIKAENRIRKIADKISD